jgi:protein-disulfide isomerase
MSLFANKNIMSFIKKNMWGIGFTVILLGAFGSMWLAGKINNIPSPTATTKENATISIGAYDNIRGKDTAKVTLVEFGDFQCPACAAYFPVVEQVLKDNPDNLRIVFKNFPLRQIHNRTQIAAEAAQAAAIQGKFWEMFSLLYENQNTWVNKLGSSEFEEYASKIGVNLEQFKKDMASQVVKDKIEQDLKLGIELGINGTPTFYLNGKHITNPRSVAEFNALVNDALKAAQ